MAAEVGYYYVRDGTDQIARRGEPADPDTEAMVLHFSTSAPPGTKGHLLYVRTKDNGVTTRFFDEWDDAAREALTSLKAGGWVEFSHIALTLAE